MSFINIGPRIGTTLQAHSSKLDDLSQLALAADTFLGSNGTNIVLRTATQARTALGLGTAAVANVGDFAPSTHTHVLSDITDAGSLAALSAIDYTSGLLTNKPTLGSAAALNTGTAEGNVPVLGVGGKLNASVLPALAVTSVYVVADLTARDALTVEEGDVSIVTGESKTYIFDGSAWQEMKSPTGSVLSVNGQTGAVSLDLDDLTDVAISAPAAGNVLRYNGSAFVNAVLAYTDLSGTPTLATVATSGSYADLSGTPSLVTTLDGLTDVTITTATNGDVLRYNGSAWVNDTFTPSTGYAENVIVKTTSGDVTATNANHVIVIRKAVGQATTVNLPAGVERKMFTIKDGKGDANTNNITIVPNGTEKIDNSSNYIINIARESVTLIWDGSEWVVV